MLLPSYYYVCLKFPDLKKVIRRGWVVFDKDKDGSEPINQEAEMAVRSDDYMNTFKGYVKDHCRDAMKAGSLNHQPNLSKDEQEELTKLRKRIANEELNIIKTDKTGKLAAIGR